MEHAADFFLTIMPILFVPATVRLMGYWDVLKDNVAGLIISCVISTVLVMGITGSLAQFLMKKSKKNKHSENNDKIMKDGGSKHE